MSNNDNFTKYDLKDGDIVTLRNGAKLVYCDDCFFDFGDRIDNNLTDFEDLTNDLKYDDNSWSVDTKADNDIMKVERPTQYKTMYERKEEVKEMTLAQVCEELGYNVKIIKEE